MFIDLSEVKCTISKERASSHEYNGFTNSVLHSLVIAPRETRNPISHCHQCNMRIPRLLRGIHSLVVLCPSERTKKRLSTTVVLHLGL